MVIPTSMVDVFLFVPNIIGYARIVLALISFWVMRTNYIVATWCYILSGLLDALDGHAARILGQSSQFGAMLDQLTDRAATMCLLVVLAQFYPSYTFFFQLSMAIDITAHWLHLHSTLLSGRSSHKAIDLSGNPILHIYYTSRPVLFFMCSGNEWFYASLYLIHFTAGPTIAFGVGLWRLVAFVSAPIALVKSAISLVHLYAAACNIAAIDAVAHTAANSKREGTPPLDEQVADKKSD